MPSLDPLLEEFKHYLWGEKLILQGTKFRDHFAISYLVVSFLTWSGLVCAWLSFQRTSPLPKKNAFKFRKESIIYYLLAYSLQIIDIFLNEEKVNVKRGYIFTGIFRDGFWQISDLLILKIVCGITYYQFPAWRSNNLLQAIWQFFCMVSLTTLAALALYRWGISTAYTIMELNGVSLDWLQQFLQEAAALRAGYQVLYMLVSTLMTLLALYHIGRRTSLRERLNKIEGKFLSTAILLWIRSVARTDVVVKYCLHGNTKPIYLATAAEACYGLPTVVIYLLFNSLHKPDPPSIAKEDILREGRRVAGKEMKRRQIDASNGGPELPTPAQLLTEIQSKPLMYLQDKTQTSLSSLTETEIQETVSQHISDVLVLREKL